MHRILPAFLLCGPGIQIIAQFITIKHHKDIAMPEFLVFPILTGDTVTANMLLLTLASYVNKDSRRILHKLMSRWVERAGRKPCRSARKELKSLTEMKIKFGSNFIDRTTPLIVQTFCINQTISLTLIK